MPPFHPLQDQIGAGLQRQMQCGIKRSSSAMTSSKSRSTSME